MRREGIEVNEGGNGIEVRGEFVLRLIKKEGIEVMKRVNAVNEKGGHCGK